VAKEFISEDDLETFEGWLRYQGFDSATLAPDELAEWRDIFDKARKGQFGHPKGRADEAPSCARRASVRGGGPRGG
jgi:hypothetical protein